jgi:hypothetical protein
MPVSFLSLELRAFFMPRASGLTASGPRPVLPLNRRMTAQKKEKAPADAGAFEKLI